jgi:hypothetical protein
MDPQVVVIILLVGFSLGMIVGVSLATPRMMR